MRKCSHAETIQTLLTCPLLVAAPFLCVLPPLIFFFLMECNVGLTFKPIMSFGLFTWGSCFASKLNLYDGSDGPKGLQYELIMNSFSNLTVFLLSEDTSFASDTFSNHGISNS